MRVIAGTHRGRRLRVPQGSLVRPTSDRVREALFSILGNRIPNSRVLDLYAGTGAIGVEAISRGATHVTCVESSAEALKLLRQNILDCGIAHHITVYAHTVKQFLNRPEQWEGPYDIVFADPPYTIAQELESLLTQPVTERLFAADSWLIVEHAEKTTLPVCLGSTAYVRRYRYGDTALSLYSYSGAASR
ncbi:MAG: 16S rRNA (guanine(966)-N(2))-methyltransferase RsmD [Nitrospira sp.]|nr:16S rRNA (guanine(966)-N(2))-methyltransferase RsmD [Nitrospira sp.]MDH5253224.1 16S rRNA (guanine(966)-N(2))-methyltransferase RsmD [Nitrospira sp.]MDH5625718.1 16S rRNA (guanine(966)-N(2))-methyltransferase RsmD [Nitrospira sp.]